MPNINIYEVDSTVTTPEEIDTNIIYIPGYATYGPVNTPTLCKNLKEFQSIFGDIPYQFEVNQPMNDDLPFSNNAKDNITNFAQKGDYEKSFIMAQEILNTGLSVLYERVMDDTLVNDFTAKFNMISMKLVESGIVTEDNYKDGTYFVREEIKTNNVTTEIKYIYPTKKFSEYTEFYSMNGSRDLINIYAKYPGKSGTLINGSVIFNNDTTHTFTITLNKVKDSNFFDYMPDSQTFSIDYNNEYPSYLDIENTEIGKYIDFTLGDNLEAIKSLFLNNPTLQHISQEFTLKIEEYSKNPREYEFSVKNIYDKLNTTAFFEKFEDPNDIQVKIITTGVYPLFEYNDGTPMKNLIKACATRGNAYGLIDVLANSDRTLNPAEPKSAYYVLNNDTDYSFLKTLKVRENIKGKAEFISKYATMFLNSGVYTINTVSGLSSIILPASFSYLYNLGISIQNGNNDALAIAGVNRGLCTNYRRPISTTNRLTNVISNVYQSHDAIAINPIVNEEPYGYCIEGNRTLFYNEHGLLASSFLNVRNMVCDIKTRLNAIAKRFLYENNSQVLWVNFKSQVEPVLEQYIDSGNITSYQINRVATTQRATLVVEIVLYIEYAIESFEITINLKDEYSAG